MGLRAATGARREHVPARHAFFPTSSTPRSRPALLRGGDGEVTLRPGHNAISLWSWGEPDSHLPRAPPVLFCRWRPRRRRTTAPQRTLALSVGDVIILEETDDPQAPGAGRADPTLRQAVRLTDVAPPDRRALYAQPLLEVRWAREDALGFDLAVKAAGQRCSHAIGNVVLVANGIAVTRQIDLAAPA